MDPVVPSICLASLSGALLFYAGGRFPGPAPRRPRPDAAPGAVAGAASPEGRARSGARGPRSRSPRRRPRPRARRGDDAAPGPRRRAGAGAGRAEAASAAGGRRGGGAARAQASQARASRARAQAGRRGGAREARGRDRRGGGAPRPRTGARPRSGETEKARASSARRAESVSRPGRADQARGERDQARAERDEAGRSTPRRGPSAAGPAERAGQGGVDAARARPRRRGRRAARRTGGREPRGDLAEIQRAGVEASMRLRALEQRAQEVARKEAENADLRRRVDALAAAAAEADELRGGCAISRRRATRAARSRAAHDDAEEIPALRGQARAAETSISLGLRDLCAHEEGCRAAVLSDTRGLLVAAYGEPGHRLELAAAASLVTSTVDRLRELIPLGAAERDLGRRERRRPADALAALGGRVPAAQHARGAAPARAGGRGAAVPALRAHFGERGARCQELAMMRRDAPATTVRPMPGAARFAGTAVLDEVGVGVIVLDQGGEVAAANGSPRRSAAPRGRRDDARRAARALPPQRDAASRRSSRWTTSRGRRASSPPSVRERVTTIGAPRDSTAIERARAEREALERLSQVGRACAMVAHEIGNPLAAIKATLQSIEREAEAAGLGDTIGAVFREIDRLDKILGQLLGFVRHRPPRRSRARIGPIVAEGARRGGRAARRDPRRGPRRPDARRALRSGPDRPGAPQPLPQRRRRDARRRRRS